MIGDTTSVANSPLAILLVGRAYVSCSRNNAATAPSKSVCSGNKAVLPAMAASTSVNHKSNRSFVLITCKIPFYSKYSLSMKYIKHTPFQLNNNNKVQTVSVVSAYVSVNNVFPVRRKSLYEQKSIHGVAQIMFNVS